MAAARAHHLRKTPGVAAEPQVWLAGAVRILLKRVAILEAGQAPHAATKPGRGGGKVVRFSADSERKAKAAEAAEPRSQQALAATQEARKAKEAAAAEEAQKAQQACDVQQAACKAKEAAAADEAQARQARSAQEAMVARHADEAYQAEEARITEVALARRADLALAAARTEELMAANEAALLQLTAAMQTEARKAKEAAAAEEAQKAQQACDVQQAQAEARIAEEVDARAKEAPMVGTTHSAPTAAAGYKQGQAEGDVPSVKTARAQTVLLDVFFEDGSQTPCRGIIDIPLQVLTLHMGDDTGQVPFANIKEVCSGYELRAMRHSTCPYDALCVSLVMHDDECVTFKFADVQRREHFATCMKELAAEAQTDFVKDAVQDVYLQKVYEDGSLATCRFVLDSEWQLLTLHVGNTTRQIAVESIKEIFSGNAVPLDDRGLELRLKTPLDDLCVSLVMQDDCVSFKFADVQTQKHFATFMQVFLFALDEHATVPLS